MARVQGSKLESLAPIFDSVPKQDIIIDDILFPSGV